MHEGYWITARVEVGWFGGILAWRSNRLYVRVGAWLLKVAEAEVRG